MQKLYNSISNIDDRFIEEARTDGRRSAPVWRKWAAMAACLCLTAGIFAVASLWKTDGAIASEPNDPITREPDSHQDPPAGIGPGLTLSDPNSGSAFSPVFNDVDAPPVGVSAMISLAAEDFCPMSAEESLDYFGITLPKEGIIPGLVLTGGGCFGNGYGVYRTAGRDVYYDVNAYEFTGGGRRVTLTLRTLFHLSPSPEQVANGPEKIEFTEINGWKPALFRYTDENGDEFVYAEFVRDGVTCTISACGLEKDELAQTLAGLLPQKEYAAGPVTAAGTVTHVDSRREDYFDGVRHHYSESHDYITVDCGGTPLTVWLPGEAGRFAVGDSVTVTYNGEPATAYNIWPGQLVKVE